MTYIMFLLVNLLSNKGLEALLLDAYCLSVLWRGLFGFAEYEISVPQNKNNRIEISHCTIASDIKSFLFAFHFKQLCFLVSDEL